MARKSISERFLTMFGDIKYFKFPFFFVYDPGSYKVKGDDVRELIDILEPGDILLRSYTMYVDGLFIPGLFSHAGLYYGEVAEDSRPRVGSRIEDLEERKRANELFKTGKQMVIHSMAEGVFIEDILTFSRCDKLAVIRLPEVLRKKEGVSPLGIPEEFYSDEERRIRERLQAGQAVARDEVVPLAKEEALANVGRSYDFDFDFANFARLSCSELVYFCYKAVDQHIEVAPREKRMLFIKKKIVAPDAFLRANLNCAWASRSVRPEIEELGIAIGTTPHKARAAG
ncbi:MAG TPA: hypothetical protein VJH03_02170 [Blastocatellia bacterium]|nr:hypothetical protein [Blastocatellia bacterium]